MSVVESGGRLSGRVPLGPRVVEWNEILSRGRAPAGARPTPDARRPTPDARRPTPDARRPPPDARRPTPDARRPTPDARRPTPDARCPTRGRASRPDGSRLAARGGKPARARRASASRAGFGRQFFVPNRRSPASPRPGTMYAWSSRCESSDAT
ncbi:hypothetical protein [Burkholderia pseudomallei]|uniref:hypothetical protein n=1 Tax=Burkholderia pseudomallei TaxID=28450 RepID=UPI00387B3482